MGYSPVQNTRIFKKLVKAKKNKMTNPIKIDLERFRPLDEEAYHLNSQPEM